MGYHTYVTGELTVTPPIAWAEFKDSPFYAATDDYDDVKREVKLVVSEDATDTADGSLVRRTASTLVIAWEDEYREQFLVEHVQEAVDAFSGHAWSGRLECEGEENTDMWRVVIRDGKAVRVEPAITWPADSGEVTPKPAPMTTASLLLVLDDIRTKVAEGDSFEGHIEYAMPDEPGTADFMVRAGYRIGNSEGQGGFRIIEGSA